MKSVLWFLSVVIALMVVTDRFSQGIDYGHWYFYIPAITLAILIAIDTRLKIDAIMVALVIACLLSIVFNEIAAYFRPYQRLAVFILFMSLVGPLIRSTVLNNFRFQLFSAINNFITAAVVVSFLLLISGSGTFYNNSGFVGLFNHSMVLGPLAAISMLVSIHRLYVTTSMNWKILHGVVAFASFITCVSAASRGALFGGVVGLLVFLFVYHKKTFPVVLQRLLLVSAMFALALLYFEEHTVRLVHKFDYAAEHGGILATRENLWTNRIQEFRSSPILGIGFSSVVTEGDFDYDRGVVETGSSWLGVLSMTGMVGMILIVLIMGRYFFYIYKVASKKREYAYLVGIFTLCLIHMSVEGYIFAAGSGMFFYLWLLIGVIDILIRHFEIRSKHSVTKYINHV